MVQASAGIGGEGGCGGVEVSVEDRDGDESKYHKKGLFVHSILHKIRYTQTPKQDRYYRGCALKQFATWFNIYA